MAAAATRNAKGKESGRARGLKARHAGLRHLELEHSTLINMKIKEM
jgi:hypothetical protein